MNLRRKIADEKIPALGGQEKMMDSAKYWGWPDRGPETVWRELFLLAGFLVVELVPCALFAHWTESGWLGLAFYAALVMLGNVAMVGMVQVIVRPFYERFDLDIGQSEPWLLPKVDEKSPQLPQQ